MMALTRRKRLALGVVVVLLVAVAVAWRVFRVPLLANIGTGYAAQQTCACLFVSGRTIESCLGDLEPLARKLISVHPGNAEVTASSLVLATATARYEEGFGCSLRD
ncbi:MAG TPA: hypothetical protein VK607_11250 [Kofleriaceae bacterium]|nr:hypothetical protein [Kofleriaceae bacterium]